MRTRALALTLALVLPAPAQATVTPQPVCSFFVIMNVARHHMHCSANNRPLEAELQIMLRRYALYISRNGAPSEADMFDSINTILTMPLDADYACNDDARFVAVHDAFAENPARVQPTVDLHLTVDRPVVLGFEVECAPLEMS